MTTRVAPASLAAETFSSNPPAVPESLVTKNFAPRLLSIATFISRVKGPCMARIWAGFSPASRHSASESSIGSTRAYTRLEKSARPVYFASSLLPVVKRIGPWVPFRYSTAPAMSGTNTPSSAFSAPRRDSRR